MSPALMLPISTSACQAVRPAQGRVAPSSKVRPAGSFTTPSSAITVSSVSMPSIAPPMAEAIAA